MKKSIILFAGLAMLGGLASCSTDEEPKYKAPTKFVLNEPALADQYFELTPDGTFELVCSQPDYGYSAITQYSAEVSFTPDFAEYKTLTQAEKPTVARMVFNDADLSLAVCQLEGITKDDEGVTPQEHKLYFRAVAELENVPGSRIVSNVVCFNRVQAFYAVPQPGYIYLIGSPCGWTAPEMDNAQALAPWRLFEDDNAIGSKIYSATFDLPNAPVFRFYTKLGDWNEHSYGFQVPDKGTDFDWTDGIFQRQLIAGKGSFSFPDFAGGKVKITVDMSVKDNYIMTLETL